MKTILAYSTALLLLISFPGLKKETPADEWISLFDGKSLKDWKVNENPATFSVADGAIVVNKNRVTVKVNGETINDYTAGEGSKLSSGTFALQGHDPKSKVFYKDIMVKPLPD